MDAVAPGVIQDSSQAVEGDFCRVVVPPAVVAAEPVAPREHVCEGLQRSAVRAVAAAVGAAWLAIGAGAGNAEAHARAEPELASVLLRGLLDPAMRDGGEGGADVGVRKALGVVATDELLHGHVRSGGGLCQGRGLSGPFPTKFEEAGGAVYSGNDGDVGFRHRARGQGDRSNRRVGVSK